MQNNGKTLKKIKRISIIVCALMLILIAGCQKKMSFQDYLDLGDKYLLELNYEEAIVAFGKAIELEPRELGAYEKLADVYVTQDDTAQALETLKQAAAVYEGLSKEEQTEDRKEAYERIRAQANNLSIKETLETEYMDLLKQLKEKLAGNIENFGNDPILDGKFESLTETLTQPFFWQQEDGTWIAVYPGGYVYIGEMKDGKRAGEGAWYHRASALMDIFKGTWEADYPNGEGTSVSVGHDGDGIEIIKGSYTDGLENGTMTISYSDSYGTDVYQYSITMGIADQAAMDPDAGEEYIVMEHISGPDTNRWFYDEEPRGIDGAMK